MGLYVSRTLLPSLKDYNKYLKKIWKSNWLTNNGALVQQLEEKLQKYWGVKHVICVDHGSSALKIALRALQARKIHISPFNFVATGAAPAWLGIKMKFVDDDKDYKGPALVTHNYGIPHITNARPVIYDASHAFSVKYDGKSIMHQGDVSIVSFHAVKTFQTVEGGALATNDDSIAKKARWMRDYGFKTKYSFHGVGTNFKMSEFHAAMGLAVFPQIPKVLRRYKQIIKKYNKAFNYNYEDVTYYPLFFDTEKNMLKTLKHLEKNGVHARRYFYPPLNQIYGGKRCPLAEERSRTVLALPLYYDLTDRQVNKIIKLVLESL